MRGLYIHIPFCKKICPYCDFYKMVVSDELKNQYINALEKEMRLKNIGSISFDTLYIGGGTPSSVNLNLLTNLLSSLNNYIDLKNLKEFTFECNPEDINDNLLSILKKYHVSRLSIGVQTLNPYFQKIINRQFFYDDLIEKVLKINDYGFKNYSFDLMYGFKDQNLSHICDDIDKLIFLKPTHLSIYGLMIEDRTIFKKISLNEQVNTTDEMYEKMYYMIIHYLGKYGYKQYETSNFACGDNQSLHNLIYWNGDEYECLGAGASSFICNKISKTTTKIYEYIGNLNKGILPSCEVDELNFDELVDQYVIMNLRKREGINLCDFKNRFNMSIFDYYLGINEIIDDGYLIMKDNSLFINIKYFYIQNHIIVKILSCR